MREVFESAVKIAHTHKNPNKIYKTNLRRHLNSVCSKIKNKTRIVETTKIMTICYVAGQAEGDWCKDISFSAYCRILEAHSVEWRNSMPRIASTPELKN